MEYLPLKKSKEQIIDTVSADEVIGAGFSVAAKERAQTLVTSFEAFIKENKDEITALQVLYSKPHGRRLTGNSRSGHRDTSRSPFPSSDARASQGLELDPHDPGRFSQ